MISAMRANGRRSLPERVRLTVEIVREYVHARRAMRQGDVRRALVVLRRPRIEPNRDSVSHDAARRMGHAVERVSALLPSKSRCLMQSLVLTTMLARRGTPTRLVIGVRPGEEFGAHAWVELDGTPLLPPGGTQFTRLVEL